MQLPIELVLLIFEFAAAHTPTASTLCQVSHRIFNRAASLLYRDVYLLHSDQLQMFFQALISYPRCLFYRQCIQNMSINPMLLTKIGWMYNPFPLHSLRSLAIPSTRSLGCFLELRCLTHLTLYQSTSRETVFTAYDIFPSVTHLVLPHRITVFASSTMTPVNFPRLTHIAIPLIEVNKPYIIHSQQQLLASLTQSFSQLLLVALIPFYMEAYEVVAFPQEILNEDEFFHRLQCGNDPRFVAVPDIFCQSETWQSLGRGENLIWDLAEQMQKEKLTR